MNPSEFAIHYPKISTRRTPLGNTEAFCRGCGTFAILVYGVGEASFRERHKNCREGRQ